MSNLQLITIVVLGLTLACLVVVLLMLRGIRKVVHRTAHENRVAREAATKATTNATEQATPPSQSKADAAEQAAQEPVSGSRAEATEQPVVSGDAEGDAESVGSSAHERPSTPIGSTAAEASRSTSRDEPAVAALRSSPAASPTMSDDHSQEQPFERDGRWWFRRGDEWLVYDERRQQWVTESPPSDRTTSHAASTLPPSTATPRQNAQPTSNQPAGSVGPQRQVQRAQAAPEPSRRETAVAAETQPEEGPFERGGWWWFRRGEQLLVYDEVTEQWIEAPARGLAGRPAPGASNGNVETSGAPSVAATAPNEPGELWECRDCGAVNAAAARSCRMCFSTRP